MYDFTGKELNV